MLSEDVEEPRGIACITYNNECARELEHRLYSLGIEASGRVFIGTVHSFSLTQIVLPYAKSADLELPGDFKVATRHDTQAALEDAFYEVISGGGNPAAWNMRVSKHRRTILDRASPAWNADEILARLTEAYEAQLRARGVIDFDDMPLLAVKALKNDWVQRAILAKYPIIAVDEYQDLGTALHRMVLGLCFKVGIRLFAVGDADQSIYSFAGATPAMLQQLSERKDVETVRLRLNYRCGSRIVTASTYALGEERDYAAPKDASQGTIFFHPLTGSYSQQAEKIFTDIIPAAQKRIPDLVLGEIAILYPSAAIGDGVNEAALKHGYGTVRADTNALYPRSNRLMRWLETCAIWCCEGWRTGSPRFSKVTNDGFRLFAEALLTEEDRASFQQRLIKCLWANRNDDTSLHHWLTEIKAEIITHYLVRCRTLDDEADGLTTFISRLSKDGEVKDLTLGQFSGVGLGVDRVNLSTLHSAKGREFTVVILFAMDQGKIPWNNITAQQLRESRRLFYVGFTRAKAELHIAHTAHHPSEFVVEVQKRTSDEKSA